MDGKISFKLQATGFRFLPVACCLLLVASIDD